MMKNAFYFMSKALFVLYMFTFLSSIFIIFKGLSVVRNCLRPEKGPLSHLFATHLSKAKRQKKSCKSVF